MNHVTAQQNIKQGNGTYTKPVSIKQADSVKAVLQAKLKIGQPDDKYEQEADRVAEQVMRMPGPWFNSLSGESSQTNSSISYKGIIQRVCNSCVEGKEFLQTKTNENVTPQVTPGISSNIQSLQGRGQPLSRSERSFFEPRFGADFSNVRVHNDARAASVARSVKARAFTLGRDIVFGAGEYAPGNNTGQRLLTHELVHVVQQGEGRLVPHQVAESVSGQNRGLENYASQAQRANELKLRERASSYSIQRLGDPSQVPAGLHCPVASDSAAFVVNKVLFSVGSPTLTPTATAEITTFVASWNMAGGNRTVRVDGYASNDGPQSLNWRLSCDRALAVVSELKEPSSGIPGIHAAFIEVLAQGETSEFSSTLALNRRATISADISLPGCPPGTKPANFIAESEADTVQTVCGPPGIPPILLSKGCPTPNTSGVSGVHEADDDFTGRSMIRFGVGEVVNLSFDSILSNGQPPETKAVPHGGLQWVKTSGPGSLTNTDPRAGTGTFTADQNAGNVRIELQVAVGKCRGSSVAEVLFGIFKPSDALMEQEPDTTLRHIHNSWSVGFLGRVFLRPMDVSFYRIEFHEGVARATREEWLHDIEPEIHPTGPWLSVGHGNSTKGSRVRIPQPGDEVWSGGKYPNPNYGEGRFLWVLPWEFRIYGGIAERFTTANQLATSDASGKAAIEKKGAGPFTRVPSDPDSFYF